MSCHVYLFLVHVLKVDSDQPIYNVYAQTIFQGKSKQFAPARINSFGGHWSLYSRKAPHTEHLTKIMIISK